MSDSSKSLRSQILIAMPSLNDPSFNKSVTLICEHTHEGGAMGIVLNQPIATNVHELLLQLEIECESETLRDNPVYAGGPVQTDRGFILHDGEESWQSSLQISSNLHLTSSEDILEAMARDEGPTNSLVTLGYAGWAPEQLEMEIATNSWLTVEFQPELVFNTPADKQWLAAGSLLGVDLNLLSSSAGHA